MPAILALATAISADQILPRGAKIMGTEGHDASRRTILKGSALGAGALLGAASLPSVARAATPAKPDAPPGEIAGPDNYFLKLEGQTIPLESFSFGATNSGSQSIGGTKSGKASPMPARFTAPASVLSTSLMLGAVSGKPIKTAQVSAADSKTGNHFIKITMQNVLISSYEMNSPYDDVPTDSFSMAFQKISWSYYPTNPSDGSLGKPTTMSWDLKSQKYA
jgi:type VI protein secretion system component Hcp